MPRQYEVQLSLNYADRGSRTVDCIVEWSTSRSFWNSPREICVHRVYVVDGDVKHELPDFMVPVGDLIDAIREEEIEMAYTADMEARQ